MNDTETMRLFISATSDFRPSRGGIAELTHQMARFLTAAGHDVEVVAADSFPESPRNFGPT